MDNQTLLSATFIAIAAAVVLQAGILVAMYLTVRKLAALGENLANQVKDKALPLIDTGQGIANKANGMLAEYKPKIDGMIENVSETITTVRAQIERIDGALTEIVDRTRLQVIRADDMMSHTMDKIEKTGETVQNTVLSPVRHISGLFHGVSTGVEVFMGKRRRQRNGNSQDEMFI
ncbi:MAG: hypothetical protein JOY93_10135 [Acidobacteriales bacterium]|nr:hypothetical protein [Terriglobales bacterium]